MLLDLRNSGQIDEGMIACYQVSAPARPNAESKLRTEDARAGEIVCYCRIGVASGKPELSVIRVSVMPCPLNRSTSSFYVSG